MFRLSGNADISEELTQDTFLAAYGSLHRYDRSCSIYTWLCAIAKNTWFHYLRKHKNTYIDIDSLTESLFSDEPSPQSYAESAEGVAAIRRAISALKPAYRDVVWLRAMAELPFSRIAEILKITENSAKVMYFRAKNQLKAALETTNFR